MTPLNAHEQRQPLWRQLQATAKVIASVRDGTSGAVAMDAVAAEIRPGVQALAFHVWRNLGLAEALRTQLAKKRPSPATDALLCVALALVWNEANAPYDTFTLVNQVVEAAKRSPPMKAHAHFLNASLRRFLRERATLIARTDADPVAVWNHPLWWIARIQREQPLYWRDILTAANTHAPMTLRLNARQTCMADYLGKLEELGISAQPGVAGVIYLDRAVPVQLLPGFHQGMVSVQDAAAQLAAPLLLGGLSMGGAMRVLDACAAPGGKTGHLLELGDGAVLALEIDERRCKRIVENLERLSLHAEVVVADASKPETWWNGEPFDAILLDAPCTASGIVRRHPDIRWLRRETDIAQLADVQSRMLQSLWPLVRPGGRLLYCTCSLFAAEGVDQIKTFLAYNTDARLRESPGHLMPTVGHKAADLSDNPMCDHDGFYYALLQKNMA